MRLTPGASVNVQMRWRLSVKIARTPSGCPARASGARVVHGYSLVGGYRYYTVSYVLDVAYRSRRAVKAYLCHTSGRLLGIPGEDSAARGEVEFPPGFAHVFKRIIKCRAAAVKRHTLAGEQPFAPFAVCQHLAYVSMVAHTARVNQRYASALFHLGLVYVEV